jgi:CheY-like chemotaxis protein
MPAPPDPKSMSRSPLDRIVPGQPFPWDDPPRLSGLELARELLAVRADDPIVVTSVYARPEDEAKAKQIGIREFLLKPVTMDALTRALGTLFRELTEAEQPIKSA